MTSNGWREKAQSITVPPTTTRTAMQQHYERGPAAPAVESGDVEMHNGDVEIMMI